MRWITREHIKVDRVACPWWKFIDPNSEFVFLPRHTDWATVSDGTLFDVPESELGHHAQDLSFGAFLKKYGIANPALKLLADIVRTADSSPANPHPARDGLPWIAHGFSALGLSDHEILNREFIVNDALYAECQRQAAGNR